MKILLFAKKFGGMIKIQLQLDPSRDALKEARKSGDHGEWKVCHLGKPEEWETYKGGCTACHLLDCPGMDSAFETPAALCRHDVCSALSHAAIIAQQYSAY